MRFSINSSVALAAFGSLVACGGQATPESRVAPAASARSTGSSQAAVASATPPKEAVLVELFVMSNDPFKTAVEKSLAPTLAALGPSVDLRMYYLGHTLPGGKLSSLHGDAEVQGDLYQVCARAKTPRFLDVILCQDKSPSSIGTNWEDCARSTGVDSAVIADVAACAHGDEGKTLLSHSFETATSRKVTGSPTLFIAGKEYQGSRHKNSIGRAICAAFTDGAPKPCSEIPAPVPVNVTLLTDSRCKACSTQSLSGRVHAFLESPSIKVLDAATPEGHALFDQIKPIRVPASIFDASVERDPEALELVGDAPKLPNGGRVIKGYEWNPACADTGGCATDECRNELFCRPETKGQLELFMMARDPYAARALRTGLPEVLGNFKKHNAKLDVSIHLIGDVSADGSFRSMKGDREIAEDLRYLCVMKHYAPAMKFLDYIECRSKDTNDENWEACTGGTTGFSKDVIKQCAEGAEGKKLLTQSFQLSASAHIDASPTWVIDGKTKFLGLDAESIKTNICAHETLGGCDVKLSGPESASPTK